MLRTISQSAANSAIGAFIPQAEGIDVHKISNYITTATTSALVGAAIFNQHHSVVKDILSEAAGTLIGETLSEQLLPHFIHDADYPVNTHIPKQKTKESNFVQESSADITYLEAEKKAQGLTDASNDDIFSIKEHDIFQSLSDINYDIDDTHHIVYPKDKLTTPLSTSLYSDIPSTTKPINESSQKFQLDAHHQAETQATSTPEAINHNSEANNYGDKNSRIFNFFKQINDNPYVEATANASKDTADIFIHPIDTLKSTVKGLYTAVTNPVEAAKALKQAGSDFIAADGPGKFEKALSFFGTTIYGSAFGMGITKAKAYRSYHTERNNVSTSTHLMDPLEVRFSQTTVSGSKVRTDPITGKTVTYSFDDIAKNMRAHGWQGEPINVIKMPDGSLTSIDNTRLLAARQAGIKAQVNLHEYDAPLPKSLVKNFMVDNYPVPKTWGEAIHTRIGVQDRRYFQDRIFYEKFRHGSAYDPYVTGMRP